MSASQIGSAVETLKEPGVLLRQLDEIEQLLIGLWTQNTRLGVGIHRILNARPQAVPPEGGKESVIPMTVEARLSHLLAALQQLEKELAHRACEIESAA